MQADSARASIDPGGDPQDEHGRASGGYARAGLPPGALVGVVHLGRLPGQPGSPGMAELVARALRDLVALQGQGPGDGVDAVLLENWEDTSPGPFVGPDSVAALTVIAREVRAAARVPVGINVLPNDYRAALSIAGATGLAFVQLDVFVDAVRTDYSHSDAPPFEVRVDLADVAAWRERCHQAGGEAIALLASIHPKHYQLLEATTLEASAGAAFAAGADAVVVTGAATGKAPDPGRLRQVKAAVGARPVLLGSGLSVENAAALLPECDGAIVGTALKGAGFGPVERPRVQRLLAARAAVPRPPARES